MDMETALDYVSMMGPAAEYVDIMGLGADYSSGASGFMMLAQIKQAVAQAQTALRYGNCGAASEAMGNAWSLFGQYAPLAAHVGQSPYATSIFKTALATETKVARACAVGVYPQGTLGFGMFEKLDIRQSFAEHKKAWIIGGVVAALGLGALIMKRG